MLEWKGPLLYADTEVDDKTRGEGVGEKLGPTGRIQGKLVNLSFKKCVKKQKYLGW